MTLWIDDAAHELKKYKGDTPIDRVPAKYGSRGETTLRIPIPSRDRLAVVAAYERLSMRDYWVLVQVKEKEKEYGIVPPDRKIINQLIGMMCDDTPEDLLALALDRKIIPDIVYRGDDDAWHCDD